MRSVLGEAIGTLRERASQKTEPKHDGSIDFENILIRDEADLNRHIDYIHWNPAKHGYVAQVSHWPYVVAVARGAGVICKLGKQHRITQRRCFGE